MRTFPLLASGACHHLSFLCVPLPPSLPHSLPLATKTTHWRLDFPCPSYLLCVAAGALFMAKEESKESKDLLPYCPIAYIAPVGVEEEKLRLAFQVKIDA